MPSPPELQTPALEDHVRVYDDAFPVSLADGLRDLVDKTPTGKHDAAWRRCIEFMRVEDTPLWQDFRSAISLAFLQYRADVGATYELARVTRIESTNIFRYDVQADPDAAHHFAVHHDAWDAPSATRTVSVIAYLNNVDEGGETDFPRLGLAIPPRRGRVLIFPSSYLFTHAGQPPRSQGKYVAVTWLHVPGGVYRALPLFEGS